jgi:NADH-quinone oxidoreductase subunit H
MNPPANTLWIVHWCTDLGLPPAQVPSWFYALMALVCAFWLVIIPSGAFMAYVNRKITADFQARVGPNRAGPSGLLQPLADILKLLQKSAPDQSDWRESFWLGLHTMALYSTLAVIPLGSTALLVDSEMSVFLPFWATLVLGLGTMLLGLSQESVPGWFGGIRIAAQTLAGSFPALTALLCVGIHAGGFRWSTLADVQSFSPWTWVVVANPFEFIAFFIFVMSGMVILAIAPFDGGMSMSDIHGGVSSHLFGRRFSLFQFGRFYGFFLWSVITVVLFLGAWKVPSGLVAGLQHVEAYRLLAILELLWLLGKTFSLMFFIIWVARVNTRSRVDQLTDFAWKVLSPFGLVALVGASLWTVWRGV